MSSYVFPAMPLLYVKSGRERLDKTEVYESSGGSEQRVGLYAAPRWGLHLGGQLRDYIAAPSPWSPYSELGLFNWFLDQHQGPRDSFLIDDPYLVTRQNLLAYSQDFSQAAWLLYFVKPAVTTGLSAPDGTLTACQFATADYTGLDGRSGVTQNAAASVVDGPKVVSVWARCVSGTLVCNLGTTDSSNEAITLTTAWQRFSHYDAAWTQAVQGGRIFELYESTLSNQAWQVWGAQVEPGSTAHLYVPTGASPVTGRVRVRFEKDSLKAKWVADQIWEVDVDLITVV